MWQELFVVDKDVVYHLYAVSNALKCRVASAAEVVVRGREAHWTSKVFESAPVSGNKASVFVPLLWVILTTADGDGALSLRRLYWWCVAPCPRCVGCLRLCGAAILVKVAAFAAPPTCSTEGGAPGSLDAVSFPAAVTTYVVCRLALTLGVRMATTVA